MLHPACPKPLVVGAVPWLEWVGETRNAMLVVALLLAIWLWMLVRRRGAVGEAHHLRPTPLSVDELGRTLFRVARSRDHRTYRELFLSGTEAAHLLGDDAASYMEARAPEVLATSLGALADAIPDGAIYAGMHPLGQDHYQMEVAIDGLEPRMMPVGTIIQVGAAWRVFGPAAGSRREVQPG